MKYKYVVLQADGNVRWEGIPDRMFTPEGMNITLEDGHFDVERARLLNKNLVSVGGGDVGSRKSKGKMAGLDCLHSTAKIEAADTIYIMTYRLPLVTTRSPETVSNPPSRTAPSLVPTLQPHAASLDASECLRGLMGRGARACGSGAAGVQVAVLPVGREDARHGLHRRPAGPGLHARALRAEGMGRQGREGGAKCFPLSEHSEAACSLYLARSLALSARV